MSDRVQLISEENRDCHYRPGKQSSMAYYGYGPLNEASFQKADDYRRTRFSLMRKGLLGEAFSAGAPQCPSCRRCVPLRLNTFEYRFTDENMRLLEDFDAVRGEVIWRDPVPAPALYEMYKKFLKFRFPKSPMLKDTQNTVLSVIMTKTHLMLLTDEQNRLYGYAQIDRFNHEASLDYIVYDPAYADKNIGQIAWLQTIKWAREEMIPYLYVGPTNNTASLRYKQYYDALETYDGETWVPYDPKIHRNGPDLSHHIARFEHA